jgi:uncharacterized damage-inducible protein DinB
MSERVNLLKEYSKFVFESLGETTKGLTEKEIDWRPVPESNNIRWILNHLARISNVSLQRIIKGSQEYMPKGWPADYADKTHPLETMIADIEKGGKAVLKGLGGLTSEDLDADIPLWRGTRKRQFALFAYLSELVHHRGQIAMLRGDIKRRREKEPNFLV